MKTLLVAACSLALGAVLGAFLMRGYVAKSHMEPPEDIEKVAVQMRIDASVNLALLEELEADRQQHAKSMLARQVAAFYHAFHDSEFLSPEARKLMQRIEESGGRLPALQEALGEKR